MPSPSDSLALSEIYLAQALSEHVMVIAGKIDWAAHADTSFFANSERTQFLYDGLVNNAILGPFVPYTSWGAFLAVQFSKEHAVGVLAAQNGGSATVTGFDDFGTDRMTFAAAYTFSPKFVPGRPLSRQDSQVVSDKELAPEISVSRGGPGRDLAHLGNQRVFRVTTHQPDNLSEVTSAAKADYGLMRLLLNERYRMRPLLLCALMGTCLVGITHAQAPIYTVTPDAAPAGTSRTVVMTATSLASPLCLNTLFRTVHNNDATRSIVGQYGIPSCQVSPTTPPPVLQAGQSMSQVVAASTLPIAPGTYWLKCEYRPGGSGGPLTIAWVDFRVDSPVIPEPILTASAATWNAPWALTLSHPTDPGALYFAAASLSTVNRIDLGNGLFFSLDNDFLFGLSFPTPLAGLFSGFGVANLDASGQATLTISIPPDPGLGVLEVHAQALVVSAANPGSFSLSNCVDAAIQ
jgi:hypothetical protein